LGGESNGRQDLQTLPKQGQPQYVPRVPADLPDFADWIRKSDPSSGASQALASPQRHEFRIETHVIGPATATLRCFDAFGQEGDATLTVAAPGGGSGGAGVGGGGAGAGGS
jgi:hypothetical protein